MTSDTLPGSAREREEWDAFLASRVLTRAPSVLRVAEYIGRKYFEGDAANLKEYNIAVEALGKPADFDPKQDSIVRVEAYRLRKKLDDFYRTEGHHHELRAVLEPGQYAPRFHRTPLAHSLHSLPSLEPQPVLESQPELACCVPVSPVPGRRQARRSAWPLMGATVLGLVVVAGFVLLQTFRRSHATPGDGTSPFRMLCGGTGIPFFSSEGGETWMGDHYFNGGSALFGANPGRLLPQAAANTQRYGNFDYDIPLPPGPHELRLYFGPRMRPGAPQVADLVQTRRFNVSLNGRTLIDALDPAAFNRPGLWTVRAFKDAYPAADGKIHLTFRSAADTAYVSGIEITDGLPGRLRPIRLIAKAAQYQDRHNQIWMADKFAVGGSLVLRTDSFAGEIDPNILSGERFGNFVYEIPVASGHYRLRLYFAETWFNPSIGRGGAGSRRFDVSANNSPLLQDFDIFREAGASYRGIVREFAGIRPDLDGYITLRFSSRVNFACLNALELIEEAS